MNVLGMHRERLLAQRQSATAGGGIDFFDSARDALIRGRVVPFIGAGIFGAGPLGIPAITRALLGDAEPEPGTSLATVAEYRERFLDSRTRFLEKLHDVIEDQSREARLPAVLEMLIEGKRPPLVVASTYDQMLERALRERKRKFAVVAHVVYSYEGENDGKILVVRDGEPAVISSADRVALRPDELVIYRPLGSPLLHDALDPDLEIDTVVATETDHLNFLGRLENEKTRIPIAFTRPLQNQLLVFLGYGLDVWHFRLVMQVFQVVGVGPKHAPIIAVRSPASPMEDLAWKRLGADLVRSDPNAFAERVAAAAEPLAA